jgi:hypothetical protein
MENDYLWNKTGEDAEIERLEKTLRVFRYQENKPPILPKQAAMEKPKLTLFSLRFALAFSVCLAILSGGIAVWLNLSASEKPILANQIQPVQTPIISLPQITKETDDKSIVLPVKSKPVRQPKFIQTVYRAKELSPPIKRKIKPEIRLTKEEKDAYNQLMLALSITGSKLKMVQAKVNNLDETNPIR